LQEEDQEVMMSEWAILTRPSMGHFHPTGDNLALVLVQPETDSPVLELASEGGLFDGRLTEEEALEA